MQLEGVALEEIWVGKPLMDKSEYRKKQEKTEHKRQEAAEDIYRQQVISALERIALQDQITENQAQRGDTFHRRVERLTSVWRGENFTSNLPKP
jgi:hypothetical protein